MDADRRDVVSVLRDPMGLPSEFKEWMVKYVDLHLPTRKGQDGAQGPAGDVSVVSGSSNCELVSGLSVTVANLFGGNLSWDVPVGSDTLLDRTDPLNPAVLTDGVYAVSVTCVPATSITVGGYYELALLLDVNGTSASSQQTAESITANKYPVASCSVTYFIPAGGLINAIAFNHDGVNSVNFVLGTGAVAKIS